MQLYPKITIITVVHNAVATIGSTIEQVLQQTYPNIEYIVMDGGSTDGTLQVIESYQSRLAYWESGPDGGVYDAMNKALSKASGQWINFMNAGDYFPGKDTVMEFFAKASQDADLLYGDHEVRYPGFTKQKQALNIADIWKQMPFSHQALFVRAALLKAKGFNLKYKFSADYDFIFEQHEKGRRFCYVPMKIVSFEAGGLSDKHVLATYREVFGIAFKYHPYPKVVFHHFFLLLKQYLVVVLRSLLPEKTFLKAMETKNSLSSKI